MKVWLVICRNDEEDCVDVYATKELALAAKNAQKKEYSDWGGYFWTEIEEQEVRTK